MLTPLLKHLPARRYCYLLGFGLCAALLGFAYYLEYVKHLEPCPLCMLQRLAMVVLGTVLLVAGLHNPNRSGAIVYGGLAAVTSLLGAAIAARHVWIQNLPADQVPECGPGLDYILDNFPFNEALKMILHGSGECAENLWQFLGIGIPGWTFVFFLFFAVMGVGLIWVKR
jgi:disulfide bond formation protein DsbB